MVFCRPSHHKIDVLDRCMSFHLGGIFFSGETPSCTGCSEFMHGKERQINFLSPCNKTIVGVNGWGEFINPATPHLTNYSRSLGSDFSQIILYVFKPHSPGGGNIHTRSINHLQERKPFPPPSHLTKPNLIIN